MAAASSPNHSSRHETAAEAPIRDRVVAEARGWIGTPYRHQASVRGVGCDCFGLIRGVWRALYGPEPDPVPAYSRDWGSVAGKEEMLASARRHLVEIDAADIGPGDVVVFRIKRGLVAKHAGIVSAPGRFIHALEGVPACEVTLSEWWRRRIVGAFAFPAPDVSADAPQGRFPTGTASICR